MIKELEKSRGRHNNSMASRNQPFSVKISGTKSGYYTGEDVICEVVITNNDIYDYHLLVHETPLEGLSSEMFRVIFEGTRVIPYDGVHLKRHQPSIEDCVVIKHHSSLTVTVDLSEGYDFAAVGKYSAQLKTKFHFHRDKASNVLDSTQAIASNGMNFSIIRHHNPAKLTVGAISRKQAAIPIASVAYKTSSTGTPIPPNIVGDNPQESDTRKAFSLAYEAVKKSELCVENNPKIYLPNRAKLLKEWFGVSYDDYGSAGSHYKAIKAAMEKKQYTIKIDLSKKYKGTFAYTLRGSTEVYLCPLFFTANLTGTDSKMGTLVHELTHAVDWTDDVKVKGHKNPCYGQSRCRELARKHPEMALRNADNHEYFAENVYQYAQAR